MERSDDLRLISEEQKMEHELIEVLRELGAQGVQAIYFYLALKYTTLWTVIGLITWGVRSAWKHETKRKSESGWA